MLNRPLPREPLAVYAAISKDEEIRERSSSGGIFTLLARHVLDGGGVVFGAGWSESFTVVHKAVVSEKGLAELRGSKYVQSDLGTVFSDVKQVLQDGRQVLFTGTPCQVAGLRAFLGKLSGNLICVDFACHAVPSPSVFTAYKSELEHRFGARITGIRLKDKAHGWRNSSAVVSFDNKRIYSATIHYDTFMLAFLKDLCNRPSCHHCPIRELRSGSDLVLGDYWGIQNRFPGMDDDRGISLVLVASLAGMRLFDAVKYRMIWAVSDYEDARLSTGALVSSPAAHPGRSRFFAQYRGRGFSRTVRRITTPPLHKRVRKLLGRFYRAMIGK